MKKACAKCGSTKNDIRGSLCDKCAFPKKEAPKKGLESI